MGKALCSLLFSLLRSSCSGTWVEQVVLDSLLLALPGREDAVLSYETVVQMEGENSLLAQPFPSSALNYIIIIIDVVVCTMRKAQKLTHCFVVGCNQLMVSISLF